MEIKEIQEEEVIGEIYREVSTIERKKRHSAGSGSGNSSQLLDRSQQIKSKRNTAPNITTDKITHKMDIIKPQLAELLHPIENEYDISLKYIQAPILGTTDIKIIYSDKRNEIQSPNNMSLINVPCFFMQSSYCNYQGSLYISGGIELVDSNYPSNVFLKYDVTSNMMQTLPNMPIARANHTMVGKNNFIYFIGGRNTKQCCRYNVVSKLWDI